MYNFATILLSDLEKELIKTSKPLNLTIHKQNQAGAAQQGQGQTFIKQEEIDEINAATEQIQTVTVTTTRAGQTILRQPTIILATTPGSTPGTVTTATIQHADRLVLPKVHVKLEPQERAASPDDMSKFASLETQFIFQFCICCTTFVDRTAQQREQTVALLYSKQSSMETEINSLL